MKPEILSYPEMQNFKPEEIRFLIMGLLVLLGITNILGILMSNLFS